MQEIEAKSDVRPIIRSLGIGESHTFPANRLTTVRSSASSLSFELDRRYTTSASRADRTITVTRIS